MTQPAEPRKNFRRTWEAKLYGDWGDGVSVLISTRIISVTADHEGHQTATIDGESAPLDKAYQLYLWAKYDDTLTKLHEEELTPPAPLELSAPLIGKARAHTLHKIMGTLGIPRAQHYGLAAFAIDEPVPLGSLSDLTKEEAGRVWAHLCSLYPNAREIAQRIGAKTLANAA